MKHILFIFVLGSLLLSCGGGSTQYKQPELPSDLPAFDLSDASEYKKSHSMPIDSLFSKVQEIRLDTENAPLIGRVLGIFEISNAYLVYDKTLHAFSKDGKYIRKIGDEGRGPGEYQGIYSLSENPQNGELLLFDHFGQRFLRYSAEWKFLEDYSVRTMDDSFISEAFFMDHQTPILYRNNNSMQMDLLAFDWDTKTSTVISESERKMGSEAIISCVFPFGFPDHPYIYNYYSNAVFTIKDKQLVPAFRIITGQYTFTFEDMKNIMSGKIGPRTQMFDAVQAGDYVFVNYEGANLDGGRKISSLGMYNMRSGASYPQIRIQDAQYTYRSITPNSNLNQGYDPQTLLVVQSADKMKEAGADIAEDANPVIIKYWLK
jgi:hypothetical protein